MVAEHPKSINVKHFLPFGKFQTKIPGVLVVFVISAATNQSIIHQAVERKQTIFSREMVLQIRRRN